MKFEKFFWGYYRGSKAWFYRKRGGWGVSNALIVRLSAVGLFASCLLLLLVLYLHLLYSVIWYLYIKDLQLFVYIVSIYANNVYYVTMALILKLLYNIPIFYFNRLNGQSERTSLKALLHKLFSRCVFAFLVSFCYLALLPACLAVTDFEVYYVSIMLAVADF